MVDIKSWMSNFTEKVEQTFAGRVWFIGLQGSRARGEATDTSDIDVVVILDELRINDLKIYRDMLDTLPDRELVCGFLSGKDELFQWEVSDLFQFCYDTTPIKGTLGPIIERIDECAVRRSARIGACSIYHACVHNFVHERSDDILRSLYKQAVFVIQAVRFCETGEYVRSRAELRCAFDAPSAILETEHSLRNGGKVELDAMSELLLNWAKAVIAGYRE